MCGSPASLYLLESGSNRIGALDFQESNTTYVPRHTTATLDELHRAAHELEVGTLTPDLAVALVDGTAGEPGTELTIEQVLLVERDGGEVLAGAPFVANARVLAVVEGEARGPKIRVFKKKRRKGMRRTKGHRAVYTRVKIKEIVA